MVRGVQDLANRNRAAQRGVTLYSPTRRVARTPGRVANAGTASQILGGGPNPQPSGPSTTSFGSFSAPVTSQLPGWQAAIGTRPTPVTSLDRLLGRPPGQAAAPEQPDLPWYQDALGTVVNNPIGRGLFTALDALQYPRRIIQSSIQEAADAINGGDASFSDWTQQIGNPEFGFGNMVPDTGNKWLDRFIGFAGDVLLDPLTYVGGAGLYSNAFGRSSRAGAAAEALAAGARVGDLSAEATARMIGRWGYSRFDNAARQALREQLPGAGRRILDRGYYFKVPLQERFWRIPGSGLPDRAVSRVTGRVRNAIAQSPMGEWMRFARSPVGQRDAITTLVTGRTVKGMSVAQAAEVLNFNSGRKLASKSAVARINQMAQQFMRDNGGQHFGRGNRALSALVRQSEEQGGTVLNEFWQGVRKMLTDEYGVRVPELPNYFPHFWTDGGRQFMEGGSQNAQDLRRIFFKEVDLDDTSPVLLHRKFVPRDEPYIIGGHEIKITTGSADEINSIFRRLEPDADFDLIDTDFSSVVARYAKSVEETVGMVGGLKKALGSKSGLVRNLHDKSLADLITDEDLAALANRDTAKALRNEWKAASSVVKQIRDENRLGMKGITGQLGVELREALPELTTVSEAKRARLDALLARVIELEERRGVNPHETRLLLRDGPDAWVEGTPSPRDPSELERLLTQTYNELAKRHDELEKQLAKLGPAAVAEIRLLESAYGTAHYQRALAQVPAKLSAQREFQRLAAESGAVAMDAATLEELMHRLQLNREAQTHIDTRVNDPDFLNLAVADAERSPAYPGFEDPTDNADYVYIPGEYNPRTGLQNPPKLLRREALREIHAGSSPEDVMVQANGQRYNVIRSHPEAKGLQDAFNAQVRKVGTARDRLTTARLANAERVQIARDALDNARRYEAGLKHYLANTRGQPEFIEMHAAKAEQLELLRSTELPRLNNDYIEAKSPVTSAEKVYRTEQNELQKIRDQQLAIARELDASNRRVAATTDVRTPGQERTLRVQQLRVRRQIRQWHRSRAGRVYATARRNLEALRRTRQEVLERIQRLTGTGGRFYMGDDGQLQTKWSTGEVHANRIMQNRAEKLIPERNAAEARYEAAREAWERINREGYSTRGPTLKQAQREVSDAWKAWNKAQAKVRQANEELARIPPRDIPNMHQIAAQEKELQALLRRQNMVEARIQETFRRFDEAGMPLKKLEDELAGIEGAQNAIINARRAALEGPNSHEGRLATINRTESQRLDLVEARFQGFRQDWSEVPEMPPSHYDLGRFESKWDDDPVIVEALTAINRLETRAASFADWDPVTEITNSIATLEEAQKPFSIPAKGTDRWAALMEYRAPARGGATGAVGRGRAVSERATAAMDHVHELTEAGALSAGFGHEILRRRLDLDRSLDLYAVGPGPHIRYDIEQQSSDLARIVNFVYRYKAAVDGGNEPSDALATFVLARELKNESENLKVELDKARDRLAQSRKPSSQPDLNRDELAYQRLLELYNERIAQRQFDIEQEVAKQRAGEEWDKAAVKQWTKQLGKLREEVERLEPPTYGALSDVIDGMVEHLLDGLITIDNATSAYNDARHISHHMQWPIRRRDQLEALLPHREGELAAMKSGQKRLQLAVTKARNAGSDVVRYTPYSTEAQELTYDEAKALLAAGDVPDHLVRTVERQIRQSDEAYRKNPNRPRRLIRWREQTKSPVIELPLTQAEDNLLSNEMWINRVEHDIANMQIQYDVLTGTAESRVRDLEAELADIDIPPDVGELRRQNDEIRRRAHVGRRRYTPEEAEIRERNRARIARAEGRESQPLTAEQIDNMRAEVARYQKAIDDYVELLGGDTTYMNVVRDGGVQFMRDLVSGTRQPNQRDWLILKELLPGERSEVAQSWIHFIDEVVAGRRVVDHAEARAALDEMFRILGDNEMADRMAERLIGTAEPYEIVEQADEMAGFERQFQPQEAETLGFEEGAGAARVIRSESMDFDEMRDQLASAMIASANRTRQEAVSEFNAMLKMFGATFPDGYTGYRQRMAYLGLDAPNHRLLVARLRRYVVETMQRRGYDPRNAVVDIATELRARLGRTQTMQRGLAGQINETKFKGDPEEFFTWFHSLGQSSDAETIATEAAQFVNMTVPLEYEAIFAARLNTLERELDDAKAIGDHDLVRQLSQQRRELREGMATARARSDVAQPVQPEPTPAPVTPPPIDRESLIAQRDSAREALADLDRQIGELQSTADTLPRDDTNQLEAELRRVAEAANAAGKPEGRFSQAEIRQTSEEMLRISTSGDPDAMQKTKDISKYLNHQMSNHWREEPPELFEQAEALHGRWKDARREASAPPPDENVAFQLEDLYRQRALVQTNVESAERELAAADAVPQTAVDHAGLQAMREDLVGRRNQAIAADDIPAVEDLTRQINDVDAQLHGANIEDPMSASPSTFEDPVGGQMAEGQATPSPIDEAIPEQVDDANIPSDQLTDDQIGQEIELVSRQLSELLSRHGGYAAMGSADQQLAGILASRVRHLTEVQNGRIDASRQAFLGRRVPEYNRFLRQQAIARAERDANQALTGRAKTPPIDYDWQNVLLRGTPSVHVVNRGLMGSFGRVLEGTTVRARPSGNFIRGGISAELNALRQRLIPRQQLREQLLAGKEALAAEERRLLGEIEPLERTAASEPARQQRMEELRRIQGEAPDMSDMTDPLVAREAFDAEEEEILTEMSNLQRQADLAERTYNARMAEYDIELANTRQRVMWASRDYESFEAWRGQLERSLTKSPTTVEGMRALIEDMRAANAARTELVSAENLAAADVDMRGIAHIEAMLASAAEATNRYEAAALSADTLKRRLDDAAKAAPRVAEVTKRLLADGWRITARDLIEDSPDGIVVSTGLARAIENVVEGARQPAFWKWIDKYTAFFKTWATAKPGFHVRNAMSATFMNLVDRVPLRDMWNAMRLWHRFERDPRFLDTASEPVRNAFIATLGSGAGGQFQEWGVGTVVGKSNVAFRKIMNNAITRWNRRMGARVEGSARLAMALHSTRRGDTVDEALRRVTKFHFDYAEFSRLDQTARRFIPFWTFMSRNLPLQLEQMFLNPRTYLQYQSLVRNFGETLDPFTPEYWLSQGAFTVDENAAETEAPWYLAPDLPHLRVTEPFDAIARGEWPKAALSDLNPLGLAPAEALFMGEKAYTGAPLIDQETGEPIYKPPVGVMEKLMPIFQLIGGTETGGTSGQELLDERYAHIARSLLPPLDFIQRLQDDTGTRAGRQLETALRGFTGAPVYRLTPELRRTEQERRYYERRDRAQTQAELARM